MKESKNAFNTDQPLHTFSIGIAGSPDLRAARMVADFLGTQHHEFTFTVEEGIDALRDLIWHIESYEQVRHAGASFGIHSLPVHGSASGMFSCRVDRAPWSRASM
jgi:asparagine synthetase B (glutamine-hydrolysing)